MILFSVVYYCVIIFLAWNLNIWEDEMYSLQTSSGSLIYAINQSINFEAQPPVYFVLLTLWRFFFVSILWARLFNVLFVILSQIIIYQFIRKNYSNKIAVFSVVLFLLNPLVIFTLLEIRLFAFLIFICICAIVYFYNSYYLGKVTHFHCIVFIFLSLIGLFTQLLFGFLLFMLAFVLLLEKKWKPLWLYIFSMVIPLIVLALYIPQVLNSINIQDSLVPESGIDFGDNIKIAIIELFNRFLSYILPIKFSFINVWIFNVVFLILFAMSLNYGKLKNGFGILIPNIILVVGIVLFFIVLHLEFGFQSILYKYTIILFPPVFLLLIAFLSFIKPKVLNYGFIVIVLFYLVRDFQEYRKLYKVNDFKALSEYIIQAENKDEPIFVYRNINSEVLKIYYKGVNKLIPLPKVIAFNQKFGPEQWEINEQDLSSLSERLVHYQNFYIVIIDDKSLIGFNKSKSLLVDFLNKNFDNVQEKTFTPRLHLYKYSRKYTVNYTREKVSSF